MSNTNEQKEDFIRRLAAKEPEESEEDKNANVVRANAYYFDFNAPQTGFYRVNTRIASK